MSDTAAMAKRRKLIAIGAVVVAAGFAAATFLLGPSGSGPSGFDIAPPSVEGLHAADNPQDAEPDESTADGSSDPIGVPSPSVPQQRAHLSIALRDSASLLDLYLDLTGRPETTLSPQERTLLALLLDYCSRRAGNAEASSVLAGDPSILGELISAAREQLVDRLRDEPGREERLRAAEALLPRSNGFDCVGVPVGPATPARIEGLMQQAVDAGDVVARAWQLERALRERGRPVSAMPGVDASSFAHRAAPDAADTASLRSILESRDPVAIGRAGPLLTDPAEGSVVEFGDDGLRPSPAVLDVLWEFVSCSYGMDCGASSPIILRACVNEGLCGAPSLEAFLRNQRLTPIEWNQLLNILPHVRRGIDSGDWSGMRRVPSQTVHPNPRQAIDFPRG